MRGAIQSYQICIWITNFAYLNVIWIGFTLLGFGIFGIMPASVAMFAVVRKWINNEEIPVLKTFWSIYKKEFINSNILGAILFIIGYILFLQFQILWFSENPIYILGSFGVIALLILYLIMLVYFFPVFSHFKLSNWGYFKWSLIVGIVHPILTVFLLTVLLIIFYITFHTVPALIFFFGGSVIAYILTWGASKTFAKYEKVDSNID